MRSPWLPATEEIRAVALEELTRVGGTEMDCFDDGRRLFWRSILPAIRQVRPQDTVKGGVALMALDEEIRVHPYTFRQVCRNGAIMAQAIQTRRVRRVGFEAPGGIVEEVLGELCHAVRTCCDAEAFSRAAQEMRSATEREADLALHLFPLLARMPQDSAAGIVSQIVEQFTTERDRSVFGLMNAVTSVARDTPDPEVRWRLEELGGGVPSMVFPRRKPGATAAEFVHV